MGAAKWPLPDEGVIRFQQSRHAVNPGGFKRFFQRHLRQNPGNPFGQHALARARRANHQCIMVSRRRDLERPLHRLLSFHFRKIGPELPRVMSVRSVGHRHGRGKFPLHHPGGLPQIPHRHHPDPLHHGGLRGIHCRDHQAANPPLPGQQGHRQSSAHRGDLPVQTQLPHDHPIRQPLAANKPAAGQQPQGNRQVKTGAGFFQIRRREAGRDEALRTGEAVVVNRGPHPLARLLHRRVRQAHDHEVFLLAARIHLHGNRTRLHAEDGGGPGADKGVHRLHPTPASSSREACLIHRHRGISPVACHTSTISNRTGGGRHRNSRR